MRVIAGLAKGTRLKAPGGMKTRPTSSRVRGAFFNIVGQRIHGATFLDLFSGSGAMGIEALSRGSAQAVFVEKERVCAKIIMENLAHCRMLDRAVLVKQDAGLALSLLSRKGYKFEIVYIDPPYLFPDIFDLVSQLAKDQLLKTGSLIGLERDSRSNADWSGLSSFLLAQRKKYGNTQLILFEYIK